MDEHRSGSRPQKSLVLVTGAGRSGTSTVAGTLSALGFHVPQPVLKANESNPRGFYESTWPLWFHRRLMDKAVIEQVDGRPEAVDLMHAEVSPAVRDELDEWLTGVMADHDRVVVKDPRASWVPRLWADTARAHDTRIGFLTMLRHPAQVLGSRSTHYLPRQPGRDPWSFNVMNLCGWINANLMIERQTRDQQRVFLRYDDLAADWRAAMKEVRDEFEITFDHDLGPDQHPVDAFIDPELNRHQITWSSLEMPAELQDIAEGVWQAASRLADRRGHDEDAEADLDRLSHRYADLYRASVAIGVDAATARVRVASKEAARKARRQLRKKLEQEYAERSRLPLPRRVYRQLRSLKRVRQ